MPNFDDSHVKLCGGIVVWDSVTRPEIQDQGKNAGKPKWSLKVVFEPNNPDIALYNDLANRSLQASEFKGVLPQGGRMPILTCGPNEYGGAFNGWPAISFKTTLRAPDVYDDNGQLLDPMQYSQLIYGGQRVDVLAHCYPINAGGNRGISAGLDGFALILSANAQRMDFGGNGMDTSGAFGGGQQQQPVNNQQNPAYATQGQPGQMQQPQQGYQGAKTSTRWPP